MGFLNITTLGTFQISLDGRNLTAFRTDKVRAMLAYLAVEAGRPHRRDALAGMFWGDRSDSSARNNLRQALYNLRQVLREGDSGSPHLYVTPNDIQFDPGGDYRLDVNEFSAHLSNPLAHHPGGLSLCGSCLEHLHMAVDLYAGDFLAGFSLPGCPRFEWWLLSQQELYHRQALEALERLGSFYEVNRDYDQASLYAQKEIELEPWRESAHRRCMRALAIGGRRAEALRQYESCRAILMDEMGIEPTRETTGLARAIREGDTISLEDARPQTVVSSRPLPGSSLSTPPSTPFIGFEPELAQLDRHLSAALSGRARVAFISGEAGGGKTTLLAEFIRRVLETHGDLLVAVGGCNAQFGHGDPYLPFRQALHTLTGNLEGVQSVRVTNEEHARRTRSALPFILETFLADGPDLGPFLPLDALSRGLNKLAEGTAGVLAEFESRAVDPGSGQLALFDEFTKTFVSISRRYPLLLALDDLQWADQGSLSLLFHLVRNLGDSRMLLVGCYRPEEIALDRNGVRHPMQTLVNELLAQFGEMRVDLSKAAGWDFVNALLDSEPNGLDEAFRRALFGITGGHPLYTIEQLRGMQDSGELVQDHDGRWVPGAELDWERIPARVEAVIDERLARLSGDCRALLDAASVQGETFSAEVLAVVLDESEARVVEQLSGELCHRHRLVFAQGVERFDETTRSRYRFRHALYQRQLYQDLDLVLRVRLHQATAEALEKRFIQQAGVLPLVDDSPSQLAFHFEEARLFQKAIRYHQGAGEQAYRLSANEDAISHYRRALELLSGLTGSHDKNRHELRILIGLSAALNAARGYADSELRQIFERVGVLAEKSGEMDLVSQALYLSGSYHIARAEYKRTLELGKKLLELGSDRTNMSVLNPANFLLGISHILMGNFIQAKDCFQQIERISASDPVSYERSPVDRARFLFPVFSSLALWFLGYTEQSMSLSKQMLSEVRGLGYPYMRAFTLGTSSCVIHALRGEVGQLAERARELIELSKEQGFNFYQAWGEIFLGRAQVEQGNTEAGTANLNAGLAAFQATGQKIFLTLMLAVQAEALSAVGQNEAGLQILSEAFDQVEETGERFYVSELHRLRGELLLAASGAEAEAEACFQEALQISRAQGARSLELRAATSLARLWDTQDKAGQARQMLREIYEWFSEGFDTPDLQKASHMLSVLEPES